MSNTNTGGPAFPVTDAPENYLGMTLRDYLAAKAMQGFCVGGLQGDPIQSIADLSYAMADAMLKARKGGAA